eukprot:g28167.t1
MGSVAAAVWAVLLGVLDWSAVMGRHRPRSCVFQEAILKEQVLTLQADFREFTAKSLGRQMADHAEMEGQVSHALARQSNSVEEWRLAIRQKDAQMQSELEMLSSSKLISSQAELRVRLTGLEIRGDGLASGREPCDAEGAYMAQSLEFLKQHVDRLQQGVERITLEGALYIKHGFLD